MNIKVLGMGCPKCKRLEQNVYTALSRSNTDATVEKVTSLEDIQAYQVMSTPALVIDEQVVSAGRLLKPNDIITLIQEKQASSQ